MFEDLEARINEAAAMPSQTESESDAQKTFNWHKARFGKITSSQMPDLMSCGRGEAFGAKAINLVRKIAARRTMSEEGVEVQIEQDMAKEYRQTRWGNMYEPFAREAMEKELGVKISEVTYADSNVLAGFGGSADGVTEYGKPIEIKCPVDEIKHQNNIELSITGVDEKHEYYAQFQSHMINFECDKCYFGSFDIRQKAPHNLAIIVVPRDEEYIDRIIKRIKKAEEAIEDFINNRVPISTTLKGLSKEDY